ncbi:hypothetical protein [Streptomyces sp. NPDC101393]|uniref:hypothetical protein n=1 Tax=Streptomyces sp. NPDC101393 TaxID=3366141 RepID=UPI00382A05F2
MAWRSVATTAAWVCVLAGAGGLGAWSLAHTDPGDRTPRAAPLDDAGVRQKLAAARAAARPDTTPAPATPPAPTASPTTSPSTPPSTSTGATTTLRVTGGSVTAQCRPGGRVYLTAWSPAAGHHVDDDVRRGPARTATLEFEPDDDGEDRPYAVTCPHGRPEARGTADEDGAED